MGLIEILNIRFLEIASFALSWKLIVPLDKPRCYIYQDYFNIKAHKCQPDLNLTFSVSCILYITKFICLPKLLVKSSNSFLWRPPKLSSPLHHPKFICNNESLQFLKNCFYTNVKPIKLIENVAIQNWNTSLSMLKVLSKLCSTYSRIPMGPSSHINPNSA